MDPYKDYNGSCLDYDSRNPDPFRETIWDRYQQNLESGRYDDWDDSSDWDD